MDDMRGSFNNFRKWVTGLGSFIL